MKKEIQLKIQKRFQKYHRANPEVEQQLVALARETKAKGMEKYSISGLFSVLRFNRKTNGDQDFGISNDFTPFYARLIMRKHKDLRSYFNVNRNFETI